MKIETQPHENQQVKITAEIDSETLDKFKRQAAKKISRDHKIQGFRPGKAPYNIVRQYYGDEAIEQQAIELLLDDIYPKVLEESGVDPSGPGSLEDVKTEEPITLTFIVPLKPEVELGSYLDIRKDYKIEEVTDKNVDDVVENIKRSYATAEPVERPIQEKDLVSIKISAKRVSPEEGEEPEVIKEMSRQISVGESYENWPYKGFSQELLGLSVDDQKTFVHTYEEESVVETLRGKEVEFIIQVESIKEMIYPELDDEFLKNLGEEYESVEGLRSTIKQQLILTREQEYDNEYISGIIDRIVEDSTIKYPPNVLEHEMEHVQESIQQDLARQNMDLNTYLKIKQTTQEEFLENEVKPVAIKRLERSLVLDEIARQEKIELKEKDLEAGVTQTLIEVMNMPGFKQPKNQKEMRQLTDWISMDTASRLYNEQILKRIKNIAAGIIEEEVVEEEPEEEIKEVETVKADSPAEEIAAVEPDAEDSSTETSQEAEQE